MNRTLIVVHPFASERFLYATFKERGYKIITLITRFDTNWIKDAMATIEQHSDYILYVTNEVNADIVEIEKIITNNQLIIKGVINGFDYSLSYSDTIANYFLKTNIDTKFSKIREDKYEVAKELSKYLDLPTIKSILFESSINWDSQLNYLETFKFPVIIKPNSNSAARNNMAIANTIADVKKYLKELFTQNGIFLNKTHDSFIIQEFIIGEEFAVNSTAVMGKHKIASVYKYEKHKSRLLSINSLSESEDTNRIQNLIKYHNQCLKLLNFSYGLAHVEYIIDNSGQPYLIEVNNRVQGSEIVSLSKECYHCDEVNLFLDLIENKTQINEFDLTKIYNYACVMAFSNFVNSNATKLNLSNLNSKNEPIVFRKGLVEVADSTKGEVFDKVSAVAFLLNKDYKLLVQDKYNLRHLETLGNIFI